MTSEEIEGLANENNEILSAEKTGLKAVALSQTNTFELARDENDEIKRRDGMPIIIESRGYALFWYDPLTGRILSPLGSRIHREHELISEGFREGQFEVKTTEKGNLAKLIAFEGSPIARTVMLTTLDKYNEPYHGKAEN